MAEVKQFNILGENISIKDEVARLKIDKIENTLNKKPITILIGDSYGEGYTPDGKVKSWVEYIKEFISGNYLTSANGGSGFCNGTTFKNQLESIASNMTDEDKKNVNKIIVGGGYNDKSHTVLAIAQGLGNFAQYAKKTFPNANIHILELGWGTSIPDRTDINNVVFEAYSQNCGKNGMSYFQKCCYVLHDYNYFSSDGFHPNSNGQLALANAISSYILSGNCDINFKWRTIHLTLNTSLFTSADNEFISACITNDYITVTLLPVLFKLPNSKINGGEWIKVGVFNKDIISGYNLATPIDVISQKGYAYDGVNYYDITCVCVFNALDSGFYMYIDTLQPDHKSWFSLGNCREIKLSGGTRTFPIFYL